MIGITFPYEPTFKDQTWVLTKEITSRLKAKQRSMEPVVLAISLRDKIPNDKERLKKFKSYNRHSHKIQMGVCRTCSIANITSIFGLDTETN